MYLNLSLEKVPADQTSRPLIFKKKKREKKLGPFHLTQSASYAVYQNDRELIKPHTSVCDAANLLFEVTIHYGHH